MSNSPVSQEDPGATVGTPTSPPPTSQRRGRRGPSPITWFILIMTILLLAGLWFIEERGSRAQPVLVPQQSLMAFTVVKHDSLRIELREVEGQAMPAEAMSRILVTTTEIPAGATILKDQAVALEASLVPDDPVVFSFSRKDSTVPSSATAGSLIRVFGNSGGESFEVSGVLLDPSDGEDLVVMMARADIQDFGPEMQASRSVIAIDLVEN